MLPRKCSRLGPAFWNLNKYPAFSSSWVEKCYSDWTRDTKKEGDLTQKSREMCIQWRKYGRLMPVTFAGCTVKQRLQTAGDTRDLEGYSVCTYMYTPTAMVVSQRGACSTSQEAQEWTKPRCPRMLTCWVRQSLTRAFSPIFPFFNSRPAQHRYEKPKRPFAFVKVWMTHKPPKHSLTHQLGVTTTLQHSSTDCNP